MADTAGVGPGSAARGGAEVPALEPVVGVAPYLVEVGADGLTVSQGQLLVVLVQRAEEEAAGVLVVGVATGASTGVGDAANETAEGLGSAALNGIVVGETHALLIRRPDRGCAAFALGTVREVAALPSEPGWHEIVFGFDPVEAEALRRHLDIPASGAPPAPAAGVATPASARGDGTGC